MGFSGTAPRAARSASGGTVASLLAVTVALLAACGMSEGAESPPTPDSDYGLPGPDLCRDVARAAPSGSGEWRVSSSAATAEDTAVCALSSPVAEVGVTVVVGEGAGADYATWRAFLDDADDSWMGDGETQDISGWWDEGVALVGEVVQQGVRRNEVTRSPRRVDVVHDGALAVRVQSVGAPVADQRGEQRATALATDAADLLAAIPALLTEN